MSLCHRNCLLCLTLLFFVDLFSLFISYLVPCFLCVFLLCSPKLPHSTIMSPCLLFVFQMSIPTQFQLFFLAFPLFCPTHQVTHPHWKQKKVKRSCTDWLGRESPGHLLSKRFLTACLLQFSPSYLWLYFLCFFLLDHKNHFVYYHTVLLCDTLIHYYLTIARFLQVPSSAHHIIYLGTFFSPLLYVILCSSFFLK